MKRMLLAVAMRCKVFNILDHKRRGGRPKEVVRLRLSNYVWLMCKLLKIAQEYEKFRIK